MRFSIRDLLWLIVVVALAIGWWAEQRQYQEKIGELNDERRQYFLDGVRNTERLEAKHEQKEKELQAMAKKLAQQLSDYRSAYRQERRERQQRP